MERVGFLQFTLKGQPLKLSALVDAGTTRIERLSVLFSDLTNGTETYQAGRYMELDPDARPASTSSISTWRIIRTATTTPNTTARTRRRKTG